MEGQLTIFILALCAVLANGDEFRCLKEGLFPVDGDPKSFFLCSIEDGTLRQGKMTCGPNTVFSPLQQRCVLPGQQFMWSPRALSVSQYDGSLNECKKAGIRCLDCSTLVLCVGVTGGFHTIPVMRANCSAGLVCEDGVGCVAQQYCTQKPFECSDEGIFPDPYDCQLYHQCLIRGGIMTHSVRSCEVYGTAYDQMLQRCGASMQSETCTSSPVPKCYKHFEARALPNNPNIYYVCIANPVSRIIAPLLFKCPGGKLFDESTMICGEGGPPVPPDPAPRSTTSTTARSVDTTPGDFIPTSTTPSSSSVLVTTSLPYTRNVTNSDVYNYTIPS